MWFLTVLSWLAMFLQIILLTLAVATGLFYLAELVEEYSSTAARVIRYMIYGTIAVYVGLIFFESFPLHFIIAGLLQQVLHLMLLNTFPMFEFTSISFIGTCVLMVLNHYFAFSYFNDVWHPFSEVLAIFTLCLWLVPFAFFVSLSANDNTLPSTIPAENRRLVPDQNDDLLSSYFSKKPKKIGLLSMLKSAQDWVGLSFKSKKSF